MPLHVPLFETIPSATANVVRDPLVLSERYAEYRSDESNLGGAIPLELAIVSSWEEVANYLHACNEASLGVVVAGAQTGVVGGALGLEQSAMLSLAKLNYISQCLVEEGSRSLRVGAGVSLRELQEYIDEELPSFWFPVDPTETSASVGGMVAVGAAGARSYHFGSVRSWVQWIRVVLADGSQLEIRRGDFVVAEDELCLDTSAGHRSIRFSCYPKIPQTKAALGIALAPDMDLIDLFIGSEGTLGVITDIELRLAPRPKEFLYILQFFDDEEQAIDFVSVLDQSEAIDPLAIESVDHKALCLARESAARADCRAIQSIKDSHRSAVYVECMAESAEAIEEILNTYMGCVEAVGANIEDCIAGSEPKDVRDMKLFRHSIPERINAIIRERRREHPGLHKLALDMAVPRSARKDIFVLYRDTFTSAGLEFTIFGHAGDAHFHVNILSRSEDELLRAKELYQLLASKVVALGGAVAAEHGIGRLKQHLLEVQFPEQVRAQGARIQEFLDPKGILRRGTGAAGNA